MVGSGIPTKAITESGLVAASSYFCAAVRRLSYQVCCNQMAPESAALSSNYPAPFRRSMRLIISPGLYVDTETHTMGRIEARSTELMQCAYSVINEDQTG